MAPHSEALNHAECKTPRTFMGLRPKIIERIMADEMKRGL